MTSAVKPKKGSKTHAEARGSHLALQARRDALARMRAGQVVDVRLAVIVPHLSAEARRTATARADAGEVVEPRDYCSARPMVSARVLGPDEDPAGLMVLAVINRRLRAEWCVTKDGLRVGTRRLNYQDILGVVLLVDGESPYA